MPVVAAKAVRSAAAISHVYHVMSGGFAKRSPDPRRLARLPLAALAIAATFCPGLASASGTTVRAGLVAFHAIAIPDDVPAHLITALAQDHDGFLWIGTQAGLVRYDGYAFRTFTADPNDAASLSGAYVRSLMVAKDGRIWIGTFASGVSIYDPATDRFTRLRHNPSNPNSLAQDRVEHIVEDRDGAVWFATHGGIDRYDSRSGAFQHFRHDPADPSSLADDRTRGLLVDTNGVVWVGSTGGLQRWRRGTAHFDRIGPPQFVGEIYEDTHGRLWIGSTDHGASVFDPRTSQLQPLSDVSYPWISGIAEATGNEMWLATYGGGIDVFDAVTLKAVDHLRHDPTLATTINGDRIGALLRDGEGLLWVGTWGDGLTHHDPATRAFREIRYSPQRPDGLSHSAIVRAMQMSDGLIWAGTDGNGVDLLDPSYRRVGSYHAGGSDPRSLSDGSVTCLAETSDQSIWVATLNGVLHRKRLGKPIFERLTSRDGLPGGPIRSMTESGGGLWIASAYGLARLDLATNKIVSYHHDDHDESSLASNTVESVAVMPDGALWVGTDAGLHAFDASRNAFVRIVRDPSRGDSLPDDWVPDLTVAGGKLWVGTRGGAAVLTAWDGHVARFDRLTAKLGRPSPPVESIIEDADGWMWIGPRLRVQPSTWQVQEFGPPDGVDFRSFYFASRARTEDGDLLFGSPEGLLVVRPAALSTWAYAPHIVETAVRVDGTERRASPHLNSLVLPAGTRSFQLEFASLDLSAPDRNLYRYRLDGFDRDWTPADATRRAITYTNLSPGAYTLRIEGSNRAHRWSSDELHIAVTVLPAFYQTVWFQLTMALSFVGLGYAAYRLRVHQLQVRGRELERIVDERTAELQMAYRRIEDASLTDPVTGLRNRRFLEQTVSADLDLALRHLRSGDAVGRRDHVCLMLDLDHFKSVNDRFGHAAGDAVLQQTAAVLRETVRASDYIVRWGGEEFLVVARFNDRAEGPTIAEKIRAAVESRLYALPDGGSLHVTCSIGYAPFPFSVKHPQALSWEQVIDRADQALYEAKRSGRNRAVGAGASRSAAL